MTPQEQLKQLEKQLSFIEGMHRKELAPLKEQIRQLTQQVNEAKAGYRVGDKVKWTINVMSPRTSDPFGVRKILGKKELFGIVSRISDYGLTHVYPINKDGSVSKHEKFVAHVLTKVTE